jgi:NAD-dependent DNA ligase
MIGRRPGTTRSRAGSAGAFDRLNRAREARGEPKLANPHNAAAGSIRHADAAGRSAR